MKKLSILLLLGMLPLHAAFSISDGDRFANLDFFIKDSVQIGKFDRDASYRIQNTFTFGLFLKGLAAPNLYFNASAEVNTDKASGLNYRMHSYEPYLGYPYDQLSSGHPEEDNGRTWSFFNARTDWQATPYLRISGGCDYLSYGPARRNKLTLRGSDFFWRAIQDTADYNFIRRPVPTPFIAFDLNIDFVTYSQHAMQLKSLKGYNKYLHAHRLDFKISNNFSFGLTETIVYGGTNALYGNENEEDIRSVEVLYLSPFIPYLFTSAYVGDRDNKAISADFSWKLFNFFEIYGEFFIDDLYNITSFFDDDWWGNKWATSIGIAIDSAKIGAFNWDYNFEYTRIEPWVYTHHRGLGNEYSHFGNSLGSDLGPNSREFYSRLGFSYKDFFNFGLSVSDVAKDTAFGGHIGDLHKYGDPTDKKYLNPESTLHYQEYGAAVLFKPFKIWSIGAKQYLIFGEYKGRRTEVFSGVVF
ncbi:MAG: capsule assembly Wzi family protein [Fibromonadaceae bacterium]|nr:capsule assembly Wzi family protein [Fibromonadaceae bacterium]